MKHFSDDCSYYYENEMYLSVIKRFNIMKVRMKISYQALLKSQTVKELIFESILHSFKYFKKIGRPVNDVEASD